MLDSVVDFPNTYDLLHLEKVSCGSCLEDRCQHALRAWMSTRPQCSILSFLAENCRQEPVWSEDSGVGSAEVSQFCTIMPSDFLKTQPRRHLRQTEDPSPDHSRWSKLEFRETCVSLELHEVSNCEKSEEGKIRSPPSSPQPLSPHSCNDLNRRAAFTVRESLSIGQIPDLIIPDPDISGPHRSKRRM